jgi:hypothetical protein
MNQNIPACIVAATFLTAAFSSPASAQVVTGNENVRIEVRVQTGQDRESAKGRNVDTVTQKKKLNITLSGKARTPETRKGTWQAYGRDVKDNSLVPLESGTFDLDFSKGPQKVESAQVTTTYTPEHSTGSGKGGSGGNQGRNKGGSKKVPADGKKFAGYGVTVKDGEKVVGEFYDPAGLKAESAK